MIRMRTIGEFLNIMSSFSPFQLENAEMWREWRKVWDLGTVHMEQEVNLLARSIEALMSRYQPNGLHFATHILQIRE